MDNALHKLYPELGEEKIEEAERNLAAYLQLVVEIHESSKRETLTDRGSSSTIREKVV